MPVLLYGVTESAGAAVDLPAGVAGARVQSIECCGLSCFFSENATLADGSTRETALEFHQVVDRLFQHRDVIPFRFPTLLVDRAELASEIDRQAAEYHKGLVKIRGRVQIDIRIRYRDSEEENRSPGAASSGAEYLRARHGRYVKLKSASDALQAAAAGFIERWREREYSDHLRCFALIARGSVTDFQRALTGAAIAGDLLARVSGPWPATEFWQEEEE